MRGTFLERLATDVIAPAKARGYDEIWMMGPSMGGFGSLFYARAHTTDITGVLSIAPFLGDEDLDQGDRGRGRFAEMERACARR